jgi:hypothetical protein
MNQILDVACGSHALAESEPLIATALAILPPQRPTVARACCVAKARSNNEQIARSFDGLPSLVPLSAFATDIFPKLHADISERVNLLRFAKLAPTIFNRARPESGRFVSCLGHGALAFLASDPPTSGRLGELRDKFREYYDVVLRVAVCMSHLRPTLIPHPLLSTLPHCLCFLPILGSSYAGCVLVGGC